MEAGSDPESGLQVRINGQSRSLPEWARFYLRLGRFIAVLPPERSVLLGLVVPNRNYAASLLAVGHTIERLRNPPSDEVLRGHFDRLKQRSEGTPVLYYSGSSRLLDDHRVYRGKLEGGGPDQLKVKIQSGGNLLRIVSPLDSGNLTSYDGEIESLPGNQKGYQINASIPFLRSLFPKRKPEELLARSSLENMIVGSIGQITREVRDTRFAVEESGEKGPEGNLQDVLRIDRLAGRFDNTRTSLVKRRGYTSPESTVDGNPRLVIFDGSLVFRKWHSTFTNTHRVVLLSHTDGEFENAISEFELRGTKSTGDIELPDQTVLPPGVEIDGFYEG